MRFFGDWEGELRFPPYDPYALLYRHTIGLSALVRRQVLEDTGGFDPGLRPVRGLGALGERARARLARASGRGGDGRVPSPCGLEARRRPAWRTGRRTDSFARSTRISTATPNASPRRARLGSVGPARSSCDTGGRGRSRRASSSGSTACSGAERTPESMDKLRRSRPMTEPVTTASREAADPRLAGLRRLAIVPAYNEAEAIEAVIAELRAFDPDLEIVVIDDGSNDGTGQRAAEGGCPRRPSLPFNLGIGGAMQAGLPVRPGPRLRPRDPGRRRRAARPARDHDADRADSAR